MRYSLAAKPPDRRKNPGNRTRTRRRNQQFFIGAAILPDTMPTPLLWEPDILIHASSAHQWNAEQKLMWGVLTMAVQEYQTGQLLSHGRARLLAKQAEVWLRDNDERWPFSFVSICQALDLDPQWIRAEVLGQRRAA